MKEFKVVSMNCEGAGIREVEQVVERLLELGYIYKDCWDVSKNFAEVHRVLTTNYGGDEKGGIGFVDRGDEAMIKENHIEEFDIEAFFNLVLPAKHEADSMKELLIELFLLEANEYKLEINGSGSHLGTVVNGRGIYLSKEGRGLYSISAPLKNGHILEILTEEEYDSIYKRMEVIERDSQTLAQGLFEHDMRKFLKSIKG